MNTHVAQDEILRARMLRLMSEQGLTAQSIARATGLWADAISDLAEGRPTAPETLAGVGWFLEQSSVLASTEEIIEEAKQGRMFILVDDEDRENEGDLVIPAQMATARAVNFMARYGRGLICLALDPARAAALDLRPMVEKNGARNGTAFTASIEAKEGISTGISAADRATTIRTALEGQASDIVSPGHVFPLIAKAGGVLERCGHTEAAVDIARLAGHAPAGMICEVMNEDGTMARLDQLIPFSRAHGIKIGTIRDLIDYRNRA